MSGNDILQGWEGFPLTSERGEIKIGDRIQFGMYVDCGHVQEQAPLVQITTLL